jgi:hypothetical protein
MSVRLLSFLLGDEYFAVVVHKKYVFQVLFLGPFTFNVFFVVFFHSTLVNLLTLLLIPREANLWSVGL